jgi:hypothetical protein
LPAGPLKFIPGGFSKSESFVQVRFPSLSICGIKVAPTPSTTSSQSLDLSGSLDVNGATQAYKTPLYSTKSCVKSSFL